ncbi:MAG: hypothetical protein AAFV86_17280 [Pseudomonadota bacterium]
MVSIVVLVVAGVLATASVLLYGYLGVVFAVVFMVVFGSIIPAGRSAMESGQTLFNVAIGVPLGIGVVTVFALTHQTSQIELDALLARIAGVSQAFSHMLGRTSGCWPGGPPTPCPGRIAGQSHAALAIVQAGSILYFCLTGPILVWLAKAGAVWKSVREDGKPPGLFRLILGVVFLLPLGLGTVYFALWLGTIVGDEPSGRGLKRLTPYIAHVGTGFFIMLGALFMATPFIQMARRSAWRQVTRALAERERQGLPQRMPPGMPQGVPQGMRPWRDG